MFNEKRCRISHSFYFLFLFFGNNIMDICFTQSSGLCLTEKDKCFHNPMKHQQIHIKTLTRLIINLLDLAYILHTQFLVLKEKANKDQNNRTSCRSSTSPSNCPSAALFPGGLRQQSGSRPSPVKDLCSKKIALHTRAITWIVEYL